MTSHFEIESIQYDFHQLDNLNYIIQKMNEYIQKVGREKSIRSQKFIRHLHLCVGINLHKKLGIPEHWIKYEVKLKNKNVDLAIINDKDEILFAISIRSQIASVKKNFTNNINSLQGEVVGLKSLYPGLKVGLIYLYCATDWETNDNLLPYYNEQIPRKLFPLINTYTPTNDRFDAASILLFETYIQKNFPIPDIFKVYNFDNFLEDVKENLSVQSPSYQQDLKKLYDIQSIRKFLSPNN
ncbi:MAG: hypothetical protein D6799_04360 [Bacteroidetes bacterium]|nr:MAG: hypothetical protein D6799_04360 [Bacteroidota bacterium]